MKERIPREVKKRGMRKIAGIAFFLVGGIFLLSAFSIGSITGNAILDGVNEGISLGFGFLLVIVGITLFVAGLERKIPQSVEEAVRDKGVPFDDAMSIWEESNRKVSSGEWVELRHDNLVPTRDNRVRKKNPNRVRGGFAEGTSLVRFWGPSEYTEKSREGLEKAYRRGEIGKTHEVVRGSDVYKAAEYIENSGALGSVREGLKRGIPMERLKRFFKKPLYGPEASTDLPRQARSMHRHWEIEQMYRKAQKRKK